MICRPDKLSQTVADNISSESTKIIDGLVEQVNLVIFDERQSTILI